MELTASGLATVAEQETNWALLLPTAEHILRNRRMMKATCDPKRPL